MTKGYPVQVSMATKKTPNSILDVADIIIVCWPCQYRLLPDCWKNTQNQILGVNADIKYLGNWINTFITRYGRWASPKYLIGESYGTTRVSGGALELQEAQLDVLERRIWYRLPLGIEREQLPVQRLWLPYFAATAWYHKKLPADLRQKPYRLFAGGENFTMNQADSCT